MALLGGGCAYLYSSRQMPWRIPGERRWCLYDGNIHCGYSAGCDDRSHVGRHNCFGCPALDKKHMAFQI